MRMHNTKIRELTGRIPAPFGGDHQPVRHLDLVLCYQAYKCKLMERQLLEDEDALLETGADN